jgi:hypothetical protein
MDPKNNQSGFPDLSKMTVSMFDDEDTPPASQTPNFGVGMSISNTSSSGGSFLNISSGGASGTTGWLDMEKLRNSDDIEDRFVEATAHLTEDDVAKMLDAVEKFSVRSYMKSLISFISFPNFRSPSEKFLMERFEDISRSLEVYRTGFRFEMVYGKLLETMPGLKLLIQMRDSDNKDKK